MYSIPLISMLAFLAVFTLTVGGGFLVFFCLQRDRHRAISRLRNLGDENNEPSIVDEPKPMLGKVLPAAGKLMMPTEEKQSSHWKRSLRQAGYAGPNALLLFLGVKLVLLLVLPTLAVLTPLAMDWPLNLSLYAGTLAIAVGLLGPNFWVYWQIACRKRLLRRSLPDALDMMVLCLEGGVSLPASIQRVTEELHVIFPALGHEMNQVQREIELGLSPGDAFQRFGERCDLEEVRGLAAVLVQSERFGSGVAKSMRLHADSWRQERQQQAEERAQRASVYILFPMLICIFPAIFIVTLAPAIYQMAALFKGGR